MKSALISTIEPVMSGYRVAQVVDSGNEFPVAEGLYWQPCPDFIVADAYYYDPNSGFVEVVLEPPVAQVPQRVSRAQGKAALIQLGLWQQVLDYVASITDPTQRALAEIAINDTQYWERSSPFLNNAAQALGITQEQLDELFTQASQIVL